MSLMQRLSLRHPLVLAPMAGETAGADLVAAVSAAGGLGSLGAAYFPPERIAETCRAIAARTDRPYAVNLFAPLPDRAPEPATLAAYRHRLAELHAAEGLEPPPETVAPGPAFADQLDAALTAGAPVLSFTFGLPPAEAMARMRAAGVLTIATATTVAEARAVAAAGFDAVMVQGAEAGGHRGGFTGPDHEGALVGTMALVPQVVDAVDIPVIAAGGIGDGRGVAAALCLGADLAALGTAFLRAAECPLNAAAKGALAAADEAATVLTRCFSGRLARGLRNRVTDTFEGTEIPPFPLPNGLTRPLRGHAAGAGRADLTSVWSGQAAALARPEPAAVVVERIAREAQAAARRCWTTAGEGAR